jgi:hypothetical protein
MKSITALLLGASLSYAQWNYKPSIKYSKPAEPDPFESIHILGMKPKAIEETNFFSSRQGYQLYQKGPIRVIAGDFSYNRYRIDTQKVPRMTQPYSYQLKDARNYPKETSGFAFTVDLKLW